MSFRWERPAEMAGMTHDISRSGVLVEFRDAEHAQSLPAVGEAALLEIDLPSTPDFSPRYLECLARVVRVAGDKREHPAVAFEFGQVSVQARDRDPSPDAAALSERTGLDDWVQ